MPTPTTTRSRRSSAAVSRSRSIRRSNSCMNPTAMVLSMKYLYSMSDEEIASVLNIKPASVRVVVHRALKSLKKNYHLREEGEIK